MGSRSTISNHRKIANIIKQMSGQSNIITVPRIYIEFTGDLTTAVVLNQIVFWSDKTKRTDGFFYKSYKEWTEETCLTERQVRYSVKKLKELGFLQTELKRANSAPTVHYKLDFDKLLESILTKCQDGNLQNVRNEPDKMSETLTEITTENTTDNNSTTTNTTDRSQEIFKAVQENIRFNLSPIEIETIEYWIKDYPHELILEAIKRSVLSNNASLRYIESILKDWQQKRITTLAEVERDDAAFKQKRGGNGERHQRSSKQPSRDEPDDFSL